MNLSDARLYFDNQAVQRKQSLILIEIMLVLLIVAVAIGVIFKEAPLTIEKARLSQIMSPAFDGRAKVIEYHAFSGDWLDETDPGQKYLLKTSGRDKNGQEHERTTSARIENIQQGVVHIEIQGRMKNDPAAPPERWSLRPAVAADDAPTVLWVCGNRPPPAGFHALGEDLTTIPPDENFSICRQHGSTSKGQP